MVQTPLPGFLPAPLRVHRSTHQFFKTHCRDIGTSNPSTLFQPRTMHPHVRTLPSIPAQAGHRRVLLDRSTGADWVPRYNIAPTQNVAIVRQDSTLPSRTLSLVRWGLIPSWTKGATIGSGVINARAETAACKPSFSEALRRRRCLIPADGFYEWQRTATGKQPYCFEVGDSEIFAFAGLWEEWRSPDGNIVQTCAILTTAANHIMSGGA